MEALFVLAAFVSLAILAPFFGTDSRRLNDACRD
jgi:hypothetical protein